MSRLEITDLSVQYNRRLAVRAIDIAVKDGMIGCLLGPSGCGKTTVLRAIAGFVEPDSGTIKIGEQVVSRVGAALPTDQRGVGMVFQDFALFPHLNAANNIGFGLRSWNTRDRQTRIDELLELVGLLELSQAYPHEMSGGEQQRIALARAMAPRPSLLLLDEPFSSMDVELREQLAKQVRSILNRENITAMLVTHDQHEAFAMADEICVMNVGEIQQRDTAYNLYHYPANRFVADFVGEGVFILGQVDAGRKIKTPIGVLPVEAPSEFSDEQEIEVLVRPDDVVQRADGGFYATVRNRAFRGSVYLYTLETDSGQPLLSLLPSHQYFKVGDRIQVGLDLAHLAAFPLPRQRPRTST